MPRQGHKRLAPLTRNAPPTRENGAHLGACWGAHKHAQPARPIPACGRALASADTARGQQQWSLRRARSCIRMGTVV